MRNEGPNEEYFHCRYEKVEEAAVSGSPGTVFKVRFVITKRWMKT